MENASLDYKLILENCGVGSKPLQVVLENLSHLEEFYNKEELIDMENIVKEDILANTVNDDEILKLNERIKALERQIVEIVENK